MELTGDSEVSYTVKELFDQQNQLLRGIDKKVDSKADKADLIPIVADLGRHDGRITVLENNNTQFEAMRSQRRRIWTVIGSIAGIAAVLGGSLIAAFVH